MKLAAHSMANHQLRQLFLSFIIALTLVSCVTINIYFPAAAAEKAAEKIVNDVLKSNTQNPDNQPVDDATEKNQSLNNIPPLSRQHSIFVSITNFIIPAAEAAGQANISIDSPAIRAIRNNMENRQAKLSPYYQSGAVGFTNNGLIASVSDAGLSVKQKSTVKKLVSAENNDRLALYSEIAKANGHPEWKKDIQATFSKTWIRKISVGWMYQNDSGKWLKK